MRYGVLKLAENEGNSEGVAGQAGAEGGSSGRSGLEEIGGEGVQVVFLTAKLQS